MCEKIPIDKVELCIKIFNLTLPFINKKAWQQSTWALKKKIQDTHFIDN